MNGWKLEHSYTTLPPLFFARVAPTPVREPAFVVFNTALAEALGLDSAALDTPAGAELFAGNSLPEGAHPIAQAYAGHQFGHFTPLGDGRAILLGEQITPDGRRVDIQLKGAGRTPYSRRGDGRAAVGPMLRELIISEAMAALGVPTTRSLAVVSTGEPVFREEMLPGAVLTRVAASHIRVGTFQWAAAHQDTSALRALADYTIARHYPDLAGAPDRYMALFDAVADRQASLIAMWQSIGFIHGVMNTDNMALSGETIDYGPCAFMDEYHPGTVFSSIDAHGRYAYGNQPPIAQWNLTRLAEAMLPLFDEDRDKAIAAATAAVERFIDRFEHYWLARMRAKLGLFDGESGDDELIEGLLDWMQDARADFTNTFGALATVGDAERIAHEQESFRAWFERWRARLGRQRQSPREATELMQAYSPAVIPRNHAVEAALSAAVDESDLDPLNALLEGLRDPFDHTRQRPATLAPPAQSDPSYRTFCGT